MDKYIAIIGDLINSKKIKDRKNFQSKLQKSFIKINEDFKEIIVSKFTLTIGDEFQALIRPNKKIMFLLDRLYADINHEFRIGIGYGEISTEINPEISIGADGEAFWNARKSINYVHANNYSGKRNIYFASNNEVNDNTVNTLFLLTETLKNQWTSVQKETFLKMIENNIYSELFNQQEFANKIEISESSLSKRLNSGNIKIYIKGRLQIANILEAFYE